MSILSDSVGIDIHKEQLRVSINGAKAFIVGNVESQIRSAAQRLPAGCTVHLESSGGYERLACRILQEEGFQVRRHNPLKARRLSQGIGATAKTDPIDAKSLSENGGLLKDNPPKSLHRQELADLSRAIDRIKKTLSDYKKRRAMPELAEDAFEAFSDVIEMLAAKVKELESKFQAKVRLTPESNTYELMRSIRNIGPVTSRICVSELPENWKTSTPGQLCSYGGLAPIDDASGIRKAPSRIQRGNSRLKAAFYMPAIAAIASEQWAKDLYARLRAKGKCHQQAVVAVMRRLLLRVILVIQRGSPWQDEPPQKTEASSSAP